ncbi:unnamed protein product [marine sediment metagenome]|uniref:Uncharacterized protein n=1 Tax=marine sediment metagenome TaxID=412755 RepID=X1Q407_9ZZZZ
MPTARTEAVAGGAAVSGGIGSGKLWSAHKHKRAELLGLTIDNRYTAPQTIKLYDGFATDTSKIGSTGDTQTAEFRGTSNVLSGLIRLEMTVPAGETQKLGEEDCKGIEFLGRANAIADVITSDCVIIAQYKLK